MKLKLVVWHNMPASMKGFTIGGYIGILLRILAGFQIVIPFFSDWPGLASFNGAELLLIFIAPYAIVGTFIGMIFDYAK